jgi:hypothetical protein
MAGKDLMHAGIALNADVVRNLKWLIEVIPKAIDINFINSAHWDNKQASFVLWTNVSLHLGLAFVYTGRGFTYALTPGSSIKKVNIFFLKLIAILSTVHHVALFICPPRKVLLWTDSLDSIAAYSSL